LLLLLFLYCEQHGVQQLHCFNAQNVGAGVVDNATIAMMKTPRCGVADTLSMGGIVRRRRKRYTLTGALNYVRLAKAAMHEPTRPLCVVLFTPFIMVALYGIGQTIIIFILWFLLLLFPLA